ncbi:hypothetical protein J437_LFUL008452 [Ladona fulva]|uniref:Uncharacterized protein n=1 Tax=Ladona fulva TaxID=123851 RepID=A0A8K0K7U1_LADFU|nr:hypothetical protein J437_LFUL008452 [Ladona fulva]
MQTALQSPVGGNQMKDPRWIEAESGSQFARHEAVSFGSKSLSAILGAFRPTTPNFPIHFRSYHRSSSPLVLLSSPTPPDSSSPSHGDTSDVYRRKNSLPVPARSPCPSPPPFLPNLWYAVSKLEKDIGGESPVPSANEEDAENGLTTPQFGVEIIETGV